MAEKPKLIAFDWDGTLGRRHVVEEWFKGLKRKGFLRGVSLEKAKSAYAAHLRREISFDEYAQHLVDILKHGLKGVQSSVAMEIGREVVRREERHLYVFTRLLLRAAQEKGYEVVVISGSPIQIVQPYADAHEITRILATTFVEEDGRFTGEIENDWIIDHGKARALHRLALQVGLDPWKDLKECVAVGDTSGDVPMLEMVGYPICFNPNRGLIKAARDPEKRRRPWPLVVERKDACYVHEWYGHSQSYQLSENPNSILPYDLAVPFRSLYKAAFG